MASREALLARHQSSLGLSRPECHTRSPRGSGLRRGDRFGIALPVLCEYRAGISAGSRLKRNLSRLSAALELLRLWPVDAQTADEFGNLFQKLRQAGRMLSQFDLLIAAVARQYDLTLLTADGDFQGVPRLHVENWLV